MTALSQPLKITSGLSYIAVKCLPLLRIGFWVSQILMALYRFP
jgi:hypothetical protein